MFKRNYYYLVAGLPDIILDQKKLGFTLAGFKEELQYHLHPDDYKLVELLFMTTDNKNLINLIEKKEKEFDDSGKYSYDELESEIKEPAETPVYMQQFINAYKAETPVIENLTWEDQLTWLYYEHLSKCSNSFLRDWFEFDLNLKNIFAGFNIRSYNLKGDHYLIGNNNIVAAVKRSTLKDFGLGNDFEQMEKLISIQESTNILEREKAIDNLRWEFLDNKNSFNYFTIEVLLAYVIKLQIVQRWLGMDSGIGKEMFRKLLDELEGSYEFPKEFAVKDVRKEV